MPYMDAVLKICEERDLVPRPARLERARHLLILQLQPEPHALVRDLKGDERGPRDDALEARHGFADLNVCASLSHLREDSGSTA